VRLDVQLNSDSMTSVDEPTRIWTKVFPNPATGDATVIKSDYPLTEISITDILGHVRKHEYLQSSCYVLPIDALANGIYILEIRSKNLRVIQQKLIINRAK